MAGSCCTPAPPGCRRAARRSARTRRPARPRSPPAPVSPGIRAGPAPLAAIFALERSEEGEGVRCVRVSAAEAFPVVLAHAYYLSTGDRARTHRMVDAYMTLVDRVPCFRLAFEPGLEHLPRVLDLVESTVR